MRPLLCLLFVAACVMADWIDWIEDNETETTPAHVNITYPVTEELQTLQLRSDLVFGQRKEGDKMLCHVVADKGIIYFMRRRGTISYPSKQCPDLNANISVIYVIDLYLNAVGGLVELVDGGIGHKHVTLKVSSVRSHGYYFVVRIFGQPLQPCHIYTEEESFYKYQPL